MPGSRARRSMARDNRAARVNAVIEQVQQLSDWDEIADVLREALSIPDLCKRSGLKLVHANFTKIRADLDAAFERNRTVPENTKILGGIARIWAKMSVDAVLRDHLFQQRRGLVHDLVSLLEIPALRTVALQSLAQASHHPTLKIQAHLGTNVGPVISRIVENGPLDEGGVEAIMVILAHMVCNPIFHTNPHSLPAHHLKMTVVVPWIVEVMHRPDVSQNTLVHALGFLTDVPAQDDACIKTMPSAVRAIVGALRSQDLTVRCSALRAIFRLNVRGAEEPQRFFDPQCYIQALQNEPPEEVIDAMLHYGMYKTEMAVHAKCQVDLTQAVQRYMNDRDLCKLGEAFAGLILTNEFAIPVHTGWETRNDAGQMVRVDPGLPWHTYQEALGQCATALRARGRPEDFDKADILDLKDQLMKSGPHTMANILRLADSAIARNPRVPYYYYAISKGADVERSLRAAKKGLKCDPEGITSFVKYQLLARAAHLAGDMALGYLQSSNLKEEKYAEGIAFLSSALEDAKSFLLAAPPDHRNTLEMLEWSVICTIAVEGADLSETLDELLYVIRGYKVATLCRQHLGETQRRTQMHLVQKMLLENYTEAAREWRSVYQRLDGFQRSTRLRDLRSDTTLTPESAENTLAEWLDRTDIADDVVDKDPYCCDHAKTVIPSASKLHRCAWCKNPSAVLRKCSRCGKVQYCDAVCQTNHWRAEHKKICGKT